MPPDVCTASSFCRDTKTAQIRAQRELETRLSLLYVFYTQSKINCKFLRALSSMRFHTGIHSCNHHHHLQNIEYSHSCNQFLPAIPLWSPPPFPPIHATHDLSFRDLPFRVSHIHAVTHAWSTETGVCHTASCPQESSKRSPVSTVCSLFTTVWPWGGQKNGSPKMSSSES